MQFSADEIQAMTDCGLSEKAIASLVRSLEPENHVPGLGIAGVLSGFMRRTRWMFA